MLLLLPNECRITMCPFRDINVKGLTKIIQDFFFQTVTCLNACKTSCLWLKCLNKSCNAPDTNVG